MPRLCDAVARLAECIDSIAQVTTDEDAKGQLIEGARTILRGCRHVQAAGTALPGEQRRPRTRRLDTAPAARRQAASPSR